jgi:hypothetical protein
VLVESSIDYQHLQVGGTVGDGVAGGDGKVFFDLGMERGHIAHFGFIIQNHIGTLLGQFLIILDEPLANGYYKKFPDTLYFNDCMILALCHLKQKVLFFPISWREEDQVSNNKLTSFGVSLLKLCGRYLKNKNEFVTREWREKPIEEYTSTIIASNL